ncbi:MAG: hypothetical protein ACYSTI_12770 [Planctomycetota bacterium]|jgi:hypothetical protein
MKKQSYFLERNTGRIILAVVAVALLAACAPAAKTITVTQPPNANVTVTVTQPITTTPAPVTLPVETTTITPPAITITQTESVTTTVTPPVITVTETITSTVTVTPPPTQEPPKWTITRFIYYVTEETEAYWIFEWSLTIRNEFEYGLELLASINYLDEGGNIVYTGQASPLVLNKAETKTFLGFNIIPAVIASSITNAAVELEEL